MEDAHSKSVRNGRRRGALWDSDTGVPSEGQIAGISGPWDHLRFARCEQTMIKTVFIFAFVCTLLTARRQARGFAVAVDSLASVGPIRS